MAAVTADLRVHLCVRPCVLDMFWVGECAKQEAFLEDLKQ